MPERERCMKPKSNLDYRLSGVFLTLLGGGATHWQVVLPIFKALQGAEYIDYSGKLGVIGSIALDCL
jgi:predicted acyltransferase